MVTTIEAQAKKEAGGKGRKQQQRSVVTQNKIIDAAVLAFSEDSFDGVTMRDIAKSADVSLGLLTYHFDDKEELWQKAATVHMEAMIEYMFPFIMESVDKEEGWIDALRRFVYYCAEAPGFTRFMILTGVHSSSRLDWLVENYLQDTFDKMMEVMPLMNNDYFPPKGVDLPVLYYTLLGAASSIYVHAHEYEKLTESSVFTDEVVEQHTNLLVCMLKGLSAYKA